MTRHFTVTCSRDFKHSASPVFATWLDPDARARFETPASLRHCGGRQWRDPDRMPDRFAAVLNAA
ncbi:MAG: hypothetical protein WA873_08180 [Jannaschia helgolandensis]